MARTNAGVGARTFRRLDELNTYRRRNGRRLKSLLSESDRWRIPTLLEKDESVDLRIPVLFNDPQTRDRVLWTLQRNGLGTSLGYPSTLDAIPGFHAGPPGNGGYPGAEFVSRRLLTLPTHPFVESRDIHRMVQVLMQLQTIG